MSGVQIPPPLPLLKKLMLDTDTHSKIKIGSNRNFGLIFSLFFLFLSSFFWWFENTIYLVFFMISLFIASITLLFPNLLRLPNILWYKLSLLLGFIMSPIIMGIIFFLTVVPTGLFLRVLSRGPFKNKNLRKKTFWLKKNDNNFTMKNQF